MGELTIFIAFIAGVVSFFSPCVLPLVPGYFNILIQKEDGEGKDIILKKALLFILGFTIIFIVMGATATIFSKVFYENRNLFRIISGVIIIIFGLHTMGVLKIKALYKEKRFLHKLKNVGPVIMGMAFGGGWTPCIGPILASIFLYASTSEGKYLGVVLLVAYSLGLGVPFLICGMLIDKFNSVKHRLYKHMNIIQKATGFFMILVGFLIIINKIVVIIGYLT